MVTRRATNPKIDEIASAEEQSAWLTSESNDCTDPRRAAPILADEVYDDRLKSLLAAPEWPDFAAFLQVSPRIFPSTLR